MDGRLVVLGKGTIRAACSRVNGSRLRFAVFFLVAVCLALVEVAHGEMRLTMVESIAKALSRNTQVRSSAFGVKKASWERRRAWASLFPTLTLNSRVTRIDERTFAERDFTRYLPPELASQIHRFADLVMDIGAAATAGVPDSDPVQADRLEQAEDASAQISGLCA